MTTIDCGCNHIDGVSGPGAIQHGSSGARISQSLFSTSLQRLSRCIIGLSVTLTISAGVREDIEGFRKVLRLDHPSFVKAYCQ
jgi:hypothetical protein